jgi:glyoxylate reductase
MAALPRVVVSRPLPRPIEERLARTFDADLAQSDGQSVEALIARAVRHRADGLLICLTERLDGAAIARLPAGLRAIATYSVGTNHIDLEACAARGIAVVSTPEAVTDATADCALLLLLAACRKAHAFRLQMWAGQWRGWTPGGPMGIDPGGKVLGIVGLGRIGRAVARRARAFGMDIHYHGRRRLPPAIEDGAIWHPTLESLFRASRLVSLHTPSTPETRGMINRTSLSWLPDGAVFVNTARGDQVVDDDLIAALASGRLAAAGLDVFDGEPDFDRRYLDLPNVFAVPHIGTSTTETRERMGWEAIAGLESALAR